MHSIVALTLSSNIFYLINWAKNWAINTPLIIGSVLASDIRDSYYYFNDKKTLYKRWKIFN